MTPDRARTEPSIDKQLRSAGFSGLALGALALMACELPVIMAIVGVGGLGVGGAALRPPPIVEIVGGAAAGMGVVLLVIALVRRTRL